MAIELAQAYVQIVPSMKNVGTSISKAFGNSSQTEGHNQGLKAGGGFSRGMGIAMGVASAVTQKAMAVIGQSVGAAVSRADQMNNFPKIMKNLGYSSDEAAASIKLISQRLDGLPTTMSSMTGMVQLIAPVSKSLKDATNISLAFNDALLAGGKSTALQANAIEQYSQMLAAGKVDMQAWRSMQNAMPGQLNQVAKALLGTNANANDLYNAMKKGKISFDQFNNAIVDLDQKGLPGFASFSQQAKDATAGIGTAMENAKNRVAKAVQTIIEAFGVENIAGAINGFTSQFGRIGDAIASVIELVVKGDFTGKFAKAFHVDEDSPVVDAILRIRKAIIDLGPHLAALGDKIRGVFSKGVDWVKMIPPDTIARAVEKVTKVFAWFIDHAPQVAAAYAAFKLPSALTAGFTAFAKAGSNITSVLEGIAGALDKIKDAGGIIETIKGIANASNLAKAAQAAWNTVTDIATGIQIAFNAAMAANPIGTVIVIIAAIVAAIVGLVKGLQWFFTQTKAGKAIWAAMSKFFADCWNGIVRTFHAVWDPIAKFFSSVWDGIKNTATSAWNGISSFFTNAWNDFTNFWQSLWQGIVDFIQPIWDNITKTISDAVTAIQNFFQPLVDFFSYIWNDIVDIVTTIIQTAIEIWGLIFQKIWQVIQDIGNGIYNTWMTIWTAVCDFVTPIWNAIRDTVSNVINGIKNTITAVVTAIQQWWNGVWTAISNFITPTWNGIKNAVQSGINAVSNVINNVLNAIRNVWNSVWNAVSNFITPTWNGIKNAVQSGINAVGNVVRTIKDVIGRCFTGAANWLVDAGKNVITGLINGIKGAFDWLKNTITDLCHNLVAFAKKLLGINSPSRVMRDQVGQYIPMGIAEGITSNMPALRSTMRREITDLADSAQAEWDKTGKLGLDSNLDSTSKYLLDAHVTDNKADDRLAALIDRVDSLTNSLPVIISEYTPVMGRREFDRQVAKALN